MRRALGRLGAVSAGAEVDSEVLATATRWLRRGVGGLSPSGRARRFASLRSW
jgi:hypothetical protein